MMPAEAQKLILVEVRDEFNFHDCVEVERRSAV